MTGRESPTDESTNDHDLAAENQKLRERVDELEAQLSAIQERLDDGATAERETLDGARADASEGPAMRETTPTMANVTNPPSKVVGELSNSSGVGVYGENTASSGENFGVKGVTSSSDFGAAGVYGKGNDKAGGVLAEAKNNYAVTALSTNSAGVYSETEASGVSSINGINTASSGTSFGVFGRTSSNGTNAAAVKGQATASSGEPVGVFGTTGSSDTGSVGVKGVAKSNSGSVHGVEGQTNSPEGYGLYTPDDAQVDGDLSTNGSVSISTLGATPYLDNLQDIVDDGNGFKTVQFDEIFENDFGAGFDSSTGKFTLQENGTYLIKIAINTETDGAEFDLRLLRDGGAVAAMRQNLNNGMLVKTQRSLGAGDVIEAAVKPLSGDFTIDRGLGITYIDIDKIG